MDEDKICEVIDLVSGFVYPLSQDEHNTFIDNLITALENIKDFR